MPSRKCLILMSFNLALLALSSQAQDGLDGDDVGFKPFFNVNSSLSYSSNISGGRDGSGSTILRVGPSFGIRRAKGVLSAAFRTSTSIQHYFEADEFSGLNTDSSLTVSGPNKRRHPVRASSTFGYSRNTGADLIATETTVANRYRIGVSTSYRYSPRLGLGASANFRFVDNETEGLSDNYGFGGSVRASHRYSENLSTNAGFSVNRSQTTGAVSGRTGATGLTASIGASGKLLPRVNGSASVGVSSSIPDSSDRITRYSPYAQISLTWNAAERTSVGISASSGLALTSTDQTSRTFSAGINVSQGIYDKLSGSFRTSYSNVALFGGNGERTDDRFSLGTGLSYPINRDLSASASVNLNHSISSARRAAFTSWGCSLSLSWSL